jgi:hypothetical protein
MRRGISLVAAALVLAGGGIAAASSVGSASTPAGQTITITVPQTTATTVTVPARTAPKLSAHALALIRAAMSDPSRIGAVTDARTRTMLTAELKALDAFLAPRPKLQPYRAHLWLVAHEVKPTVAPARLAALLWCTVWFPDDCG